MDELTTPQVAALLGCDPSHVRRLARDGKIKERRLTSRLVLYDPASVEEYKAKASIEGQRGWQRGRPRSGVRGALRDKGISGPPVAEQSS